MSWKEANLRRDIKVTPPADSTTLLAKQPPVSTEDATRSLACALAKWAVTAAKKKGQV